MNPGPNTNADEILIKLCLKNDRRAQEALYKKYAPRMFSLCIRYMGNNNDAKDVLQDGFITVFSKIGDYRNEGSFEGWMRRVFATTALIKLRRKRPVKEVEDLGNISNTEFHSEDIISTLSYNDLLDLVAQLPERYRIVFNMYVIEGFSHKEIGDFLGINEVSSRSCLNRARQWLQTKIKDGRQGF